MKAPFRERYCGGGDLAACSASLWAALDAAGNELAGRAGARTRRPGAPTRTPERISLRAGPDPADDALDEPADLPAGDHLHGPPSAVATAAARLRPDGREAVPDDAGADARAARRCSPRSREPVVHHRGPDFRAVLRVDCLERLQEVYRTEGDVLLFTASGTGAMESAVANLLAPGDRVLVVSAGYFGERWATIARAYGADVEQLAYEWGETPSAGRPRVAARRARRRRRSCFLTQSRDLDRRRRRRPGAGRGREGGGRARRRRRDLEPRRRAARDRRVGDRRRRLRLAEGADDPARARDRLRLAGGLGRARTRRRASTSTGQRRRKAQANVDTPFTPAVSLVVALDVALGLLLEEGLEAAFERHVRLGRACREGDQGDGPRALLARTTTAPPS